MKKHSSKLHVIAALLVVSIGILLGWFSQRLSLSVDVTANNRHSLSSTTLSLLQSMYTPVELIAVLAPDTQQRDGIEALVEKFQDIKSDITLRFVNPETDPAQARELNAAPGGELILRTATREQRLQNLSERSLANSLQQLTRDGEKHLVFISGHGERSPSQPTNDDWSIIAEQLANIGLIAREQSLVSEPSIDDDVDLVVIAAPTKKYFPGELASIDNYIQGGGNLLWLIEQDSENSNAPDFSLLSSTLGVVTLPGTVVDTASQALAADSPDFVLLDRFTPHPITSTLASPVLMPQATALAVTPQAGQEILPLLQTPEASWTETGQLSGEIRFDADSSEISGPLLLGVTIERALQTGSQRFAVIGDADFAASQFVGNGGNQHFTESLVLWLIGEADSMEFVTQRAPDSQLSLSNRSAIFISVLYLVAFPLLFLVVAGIVRWRRKRDK